MTVSHEDGGLEQIERDPDVGGGYGADVVKGFRRCMSIIRSARDERDIRAQKGRRLEKLSGNRSHQWSMRVTDQWRLILEFEGKHPNKTCVIVGIEDYH